MGLNATNPSFFFINVGLCLKKKREHATYDIRDSYYKPVAPALCWCNNPGSAPSHRAGLEPGVSSAGCGALTRNAKGYMPLEHLFLRSGEWGLHTALTGIHICYIDIPQWVLTRHLRTFFFCCFLFFVQSAFSTPRSRSHWLIQAIKRVIRV